MTEQNAIVKQDDSMFLSPVASMAQFADRYNVFKDFVSGMLKACEKVLFHQVWLLVDAGLNN
jgi:hypothetical protein